MPIDHLISVLIAIAAYAAVLGFGLACVWLSHRHRRRRESRQLDW